MSDKVNLNLDSIERKVKDIARQKAVSTKYDVVCRNCKNKLSVPVGKSKCPFCGEEINFRLRINF